MIRCIIIDDEPHAIEVVRNYCNTVPYLQVLGEFRDPKHAASFIEKRRADIDLVFLDIEMPGFSGIDFLRAYSFPHVIMVTAYAHYAADTYRYGVTDYLLKPIDPERFAMAIAKVYTRYEENNALKNAKNAQREEALYLKTERYTYTKVSYADIKYIQAAQNNAMIRTTSGEIVVSQRLSELESQLPATRFRRIHKSYIIHMDYFVSLHGSRIKLAGVDKDLPLGDKYKREFVEHIRFLMNDE